MKPPEEQRSHRTQPGDSQPHGHHGLMMIACCIPMLVIAAIIAISGAGLGFLVAAVACTAMMAAMMGGMSHGDDDPGSRR